MSISEEIKKLAETLSHIEEGDSVSPMHGTLADLVNIVRGRDHTYKGTQGWGSKFGLINQHKEGENGIIVFADSGLGQIWIKVPQKNIDRAKAGAKTKKPDLSTLIPLDGVEVKYTDDEQNINWHGSAQNFIPLFNKGKFPPPLVAAPKDESQHYYQGSSWDKAGTLERTSLPEPEPDTKSLYRPGISSDEVVDMMKKSGQDADQKVKQINRDLERDIKALDEPDFKDKKAKPPGIGPANDDVYESLAEQIKALTNTLAKLEKNKD